MKETIIRQIAESDMDKMDMTKIELIEVIKLVLFDDVEDGGF